MFERFCNPLFLRRTLAVALCMGMIGALKPVLFNEGGSMAKYIAKQCQMEMVGEQEAEAYLEAVLFGEGEVPPVPDEAVPEAERRQVIDMLFRIDGWIAIALGVGVLLLLVPILRERGAFHHFLLVLSLWLILEAIGASFNGGKAHAELSFFAHAARWGMPLVLWGMIRRTQRDPEAAGPSPALTHLAVVVTALTFATHGWEALRLHASFQDLIHGFVGLLGLHVSPGVVASLLRVIGVMDLLLAVTILFCRHPRIFLWMACWGLITGLSRPLTLGVDAWPELAMRTANFALPLFLYLTYSNPKKSTS